MKPVEAQALFAEMRSAYPNANVDADTVRIYQRELLSLNHELAKEAVVSALGTCRFLPTIADIRHHYGIAREQKRRRDEAENRRLERIAEDNLPRVPLRDIPAVQERLAGNPEAEALLNLEQVSEGKCDDCTDVGVRYAFFSLALCSRCVSNRLRVKAQVEESAA